MRSRWPGVSERANERRKLAKPLPQKGVVVAASSVASHELRQRRIAFFGLFSAIVAPGKTNDGSGAGQDRVAVHGPSSITVVGQVAHVAMHIFRDEPAESSIVLVERHAGVGEPDSVERELGGASADAVGEALHAASM